MGDSVDAMSQARWKQFIEEHNIACPSCGKHNFTDIRTVQPHVQDLPGRYRGREEHRLSPPGNRSGYLRKLSKRPAHDAPESCPSVSARSASPSATRSPRATSPSAPANLSRWSWNSSASRAPNWSGLTIGRTSATSSCCQPRHDRRRTCACATMSPEELSFYSNATTDIEFLFPFGWGELWGVADRTDLRPDRSIRSTSGERLDVLRSRNKRALHSLRASSPLWARTGSRSPSSCDAYDEEVVGQERTARRRPHRPAPASGARSVQGCGAAPVQEADRQGGGDLGRCCSKYFMVDYDDAGSIGKRYRRRGRDRHAVLRHRRFRHRDRTAALPCATATRMQQERVKIEDVATTYIAKKIEF